MKWSRKIETQDISSYRSSATEYLFHRLKLVGFVPSEIKNRLSVFVGQNVFAFQQELDICNQGNICITLDLNQACAKLLGARPSGTYEPEVDLEFFSPNETRMFMKSHKPTQSFIIPEDAQPKLGPKERPVWFWKQVGRGGVLTVGTDLIQDLLLPQQGDPEMVTGDARKVPKWGFDSERPNYLFEPLRQGRRKHERSADLWAFFLARTLKRIGNFTMREVLPNGAVGVIVITGDDDQAYLEKYEEQRRLLKGIPMTYFLHPKTRHTSESLRRLAKFGPLEIGIHPDALESPEMYSTIFADQVDWFTKSFKTNPVLVRNHGFLNDGYWGHANDWIGREVHGSSNIPGFDGTVLNGSLLPSRLFLDGSLTPHWSMLTTIGDGVLFAGGYSSQQAGNLVLEVAQSIRDSGMPGVMVLNLHPQNVTEAKHMHESCLSVINSGFLPLSLGETFNWFASRDESSFPDSRLIQGPLTQPRERRRLRRSWFL